MNRLAIISPEFNEWEYHIYKSLCQKYEVVAYTGHSVSSPPLETAFPVKPLPTAPYNASHLFGLEKELERADLIYITDTGASFSYQAATVRQRTDAKLVAFVSENFSLLRPDKYYQRIQETVVAHTDHFIAASERMKLVLIALQIPLDLITVIPMGVCTELFFPAPQIREASRRELGYSEKDIVILFVGSLVWENGIFDLALAAKLLCENLEIDHRVPKFLLVGEGQEEKRLRAILENLGISNQFLLLKELPYENMPEVYNLADIFVHPGIPNPIRQEPSERTLLESMACGKPIVSTSYGCTPELVGNAGILTSCNDPVSLSEGLKSLLLDVSLWEKLAEAALWRIHDKFDSLKIAERLSQLFARILDD